MLNTDELHNYLLLLLYCYPSSHRHTRQSHSLAIYRRRTFESDVVVVLSYQRERDLYLEKRSMDGEKNTTKTDIARVRMNKYIAIRLVHI